MNQPRRHHYVPVFYQSGFADSDGRLWLYDRKTQRYAKTHPKNICCEKEMYTIDPEGRQDRQIESEFLSGVDGEAARAIRLLSTTADLPDEWKESFSIFMGFLITRSPAFRTSVTQMHRTTAEEFMRLMTTDVDRAKAHLERYRQLTGDQLEGVSPEGMVEAVRGGHLKVSVTERPFLEGMFKHSEFLSRWIYSFGWHLLSAPFGSGFLIDFGILNWPSSAV